MQLTREEAADIVDDDHDDWETEEKHIVETSRWSIIEEGIFKHIPSGKFYSLWGLPRAYSPVKSPHRKTMYPYTITA